MSAYSILPTRSPAKYRGKYPARARSVSCGATGVHVELNNGLRLWSYGGKLRELPRVGDDFAAELDAAPAMTAEHYAKLCEAAELSRKAPEGETNAARTIARAEKAAAIRDLLDSILAPVPAPAAPVDSGLFDPMGGLRGTGHIVPETLAERAGLNVRPVMADNGPAFEAAPEVACVTVTDSDDGAFRVAAEDANGFPTQAIEYAPTHAEAERAARAMAARFEVSIVDSTREGWQALERAQQVERAARAERDAKAIPAPVLIAETARARYWRTQAGFVSTLPGAELTADTGAGYNRLDSLMRLKGESAETIDSTLRAEVLRLEQAGRDAAERETGRVIDMTPTWAGILPTLRALIENGNAEGRRTAWAELEKMARLADERNRMAESFAELAALLPDWPTMRALSAWGAEKATAKKAAARDIIARHIPETISKESSK